MEEAPMFSQFDNDNVEVYLKRLNSQLKRMPAEERAEVHQELRQHMDALIAAHMELDATLCQATDAALEQLGNPKQIGRRLFREWQQTAFPGERQVLPAILTVLMIHFACILGSLLIDQENWMSPILNQLPAWLLPYTILVAPPLVAGIVAVRRFPLGGLKGVILGHLGIPLMMLITIFYGGTTGTFFDMAHDSSGIIRMILLASSIWMGLGCGAGFLTRLIGQKRLGNRRRLRFQR
jgi:uncharacterized membrane protein